MDGGLMDSLIKRFDAKPDRDLRLATHRGVAYQTDFRAGRVSYGKEYWAKVSAYEGTDISQAVNNGRLALMDRHLALESTVIDYGCGTGEFLRAARTAGFDARGCDILPAAIARLQELGLYADDVSKFEAVCMWDTIEHMDDPELVLRSIRKGAWLFVSVPIFSDLWRIRESKHYRPGEHLYYWTEQGFADWLALYGFRLVEKSDHEIAAGRESIGAFAFVRDLPDFQDHVAAYRTMHAGRHYGDSATELHLEDVAKVVRASGPKSILDYGCGRSDLVAHFWLDGRRRIARYDPGIPTFKAMPPGQFDLVLCMDTLEHIPMSAVDVTLAQIRQKSEAALFTISTKPSRAKLPDGRNAHVTLLTDNEWTRWLGAVFGKVKRLPSKWEHELMIAAGPITSIV